MEQFGENLKIVRTFRELSQKDISDLIGVDRSTWSNYERNITEPDLETLYNIVKKLHIPMEWLFFETAYLTKKLEEVKRTGETGIIIEPEKAEDLVMALKEIINTKNSLVASLNAQIVALQKRVKELEKGKGK